MNQCNFIGHLGQDVELRQAGSSQVANVSMAVTKKVKGEPITVWVPLTFWNKTAELVAQYCKKGSKLRVTGEFSMREWEDQQTQSKRSAPVFTVWDMEFLGDKHQGQGNQQQGSQQNNQYNTGGQNFQNHPPQNQQNQGYQNQQYGNQPQGNDNPFAEDD
jgi:single-strand DNA-binding protein